MDARLRFNIDPNIDPTTLSEGWPYKHEPDPYEIDEGEAQPLPSSTSWNSRPDANRWLSERQLGTADALVSYRIEGWLAERGTSVWFGAGSTGKTQLLLWMAALLASRPEDRPATTWLGGEIHGTGHVLILTAEDTREQIVGRLKDVVTHAMRQSPEASRRTCARIHIMPFLSMSEKEFKHPSASLFQQNKDKGWEPTEVMKEIRRYIEEWNRSHDAEDRIIGVVMDSATSMAGFESMDAQATTNFFFYLGRLCERLRIFWAIIGHTPKSTTVKRYTYRATAASRLRGVAMWTTAPRLTVEVRLLQDWGRSKADREAGPIRDCLGDLVKREDLLKVYVAKANLKGVCWDERILARQRHGAFADVTDDPAEVVRSGLLGPPRREGDGGEQAQTTSPDPDADPGSGTPTATRSKPGPRTRDPKQLTPGTDLVLELLLEAYPATIADTRVSANLLKRMLARRLPADPRAALVTSASGGGKTGARVASITWHLAQLHEREILKKSGRFFHLTAKGVDSPGTSTPTADGEGA